MGMVKTILQFLLAMLLGLIQGFFKVLGWIILICIGLAIGPLGIIIVLLALILYTLNNNI